MSLRHSNCARHISHVPSSSPLRRRPSPGPGAFLFLLGRKKNLLLSRKTLFLKLCWSGRCLPSLTPHTAHAVLICCCSRVSANCGARPSLPSIPCGARCVAPLPCAVASKEAIEILWFWGSPRAITHIGQGETVKWVWWDDRPHSIEGEGTGLTMFKGEGGWTETVARRGFSYTYKFDNPGTFNYHCHNHSEIMVGTVIVKPKYNIGGVKILWYDGVSLGGASAIIEEGDTVTWQWLDDLGHSLQDANGDPEFFPGKGGGGFPITESGFQYNKTYTKAGIYAYVCGQHITTMRGAIQVVPKGSTLPPLPEVLSSKAPTLPREGAGTPPPGVDSGDILISSKPNPSVAYPQTSWGAAWLVSLVLGLVLFMV